MSGLKVASQQNEGKETQDGQQDFDCRDQRLSFEENPVLKAKRFELAHSSLYGMLIL